MRTLATAHDQALVYANRAHGVPRPADEQPAQALCTGGHLGVIVSHFSGRGQLAGGIARHPEREPTGAITARDHHSLVIPYHRDGAAAPAGERPTGTLTTPDRAALLVPAGGTWARETTLDREPVPTQTSREARAVVFSDADIDDCRFRMFSLGEIADAMAMGHHLDGGAYVVLGNKRERMAQYGNAVTPPAMALIVSRLLEVLDA